MPIIIMYDGTVESTMQLAQDMDLNYPILIDSKHEIFDRWNAEVKLPSTTMIRRGSVVHSIDQTWYTDLIEDVVYNY